MTTDTTPAPSVDAIKDFMETWGISRNPMAEAMGLSKQSMSNKYSPTNVDKFSPEHHRQMLKYLASLHQALGAFLQEGS